MVNIARKTRMKHIRIRGRERNSEFKKYKNGCLQDRLIEHCVSFGITMFQEFTHCLLLNKEKLFQILDLLPSSGERVGRHFPSTGYCVLLNMRRGAEFRNHLKVPRPETFSTERSVTFRKGQLAKSNGYNNTLVKKSCGLNKIRITTIK